MKKNKSSRYIWITISIILILILFAAIARPIISGNAFLQNKIKNSQKTVSTNQNAISLTKETLPSFLASQQIITDLPDNSIISLKLYNFDGGGRNWEESYIIKKGKIEIGNTDNPDITVFLDSKHLKNLGNLCDAVKQAKSNGDIGYDTKMSQLSIMWKYKKLLKYRNCFGL